MQAPLAQLEAQYILALFHLTALPQYLPFPINRFR